MGELGWLQQAQQSAGNSCGLQGCGDDPLPALRFVDTTAVKLPAIRGRQLLAALMLAMAWSGAAPQSPADLGLTRADHDGSGSMLRLLQIIGPARCQADSQCHTVAVGANACGGPEAYLAWSSTGARRADVLRWVSRYNSQRQTWRERQDTLGVCRLVTDPGAHCDRPSSSEGHPGSAGRCAVNSPAGNDPR